MGSVWAFLRKPAMRAVGLLFLAECASKTSQYALSNAGTLSKSVRLLVSFEEG